MKLMRDTMARRGVPPFETDAVSIVGRLDWIIEGLIVALKFEQELKDGVIPLPPPVLTAA